MIKNKLVTIFICITLNIPSIFFNLKAYEDYESLDRVIAVVEKSVVTKNELERAINSVIIQFETGSRQKGRFLTHLRKRWEISLSKFLIGHNGVEMHAVTVWPGADRTKRSLCSSNGAANLFELFLIFVPSLSWQMFGF